MPKRKKQLSLQDHINKYPTTTLQSALQELEHSIFWDILKAYLQMKQRSFEIASLDLVGHSGKECEAAKASGYAQALEDVSDNYMKELHQILKGATGVFEDPVPQDEIEQV